MSAFLPNVLICSSVGKKISTHQPTGKPYVSPSFGTFLFGKDNLEREDVTDFYKYEEGKLKRIFIEAYVSLLAGDTILGRTTCPIKGRQWWFAF